MSFDISFVSAAAGVVASLLAAVGSRLAKRSSERHLANLQEDARRKLAEILANAYQGRAAASPGRQVSSQLLKEVEQGVIEGFSVREGLSREQVGKEVENRTEELRKRLESIENRFPDDSTIDKVASINDALFAQRIEQLAARIGKIEDKILTKWDVALIVSIIAAGIFSVVGATYAVLKALGHAS
ncbi:hypothetical protein [Xanthomonas citri]|uniref:hypothetical protein n=1 Tax=Xanthomonas citri TaxID=346 RepID=UPI001314664B|nr:hypothetical protein [Xanthomonas citri]QTJ32035.1 hypothetical protein XcfCFBP6165P_22870 [Xanthomonas citri pv. phaseoli var. fuscans]QTL00992.1 hypothetical protein J4T80_09480 [Xanthomonas citri pv. fuscans]